MMEQKIETIIELCKIKDRTELFCRYTHYVDMYKIDCPYYIKKENVILSECNYYKINKLLNGEIK